jgi:hypothetical protein
MAVLWVVLPGESKSPEVWHPEDAGSPAARVR